MLDTYRRYQITLNLKKCLFCVPFGTLLGHVVCRQGLMVDPTKIMVILNMEGQGVWSSCLPLWDIQDITKILSKDMPRSPHIWRNYWIKMSHSAGMMIVIRALIYWKKRWLPRLSRIPRLEERVSCTCQHVMYSTRRNTDIGWWRSLGPSYHIWKPSIIQSREELFHHWAQGASYGVRTLEV